VLAVVQTYPSDSMNILVAEPAVVSAGLRDDAPINADPMSPAGKSVVAFEVSASAKDGPNKASERTNEAAPKSLEHIKPLSAASLAAQCQRWPDKSREDWDCEHIPSSAAT